MPESNGQPVPLVIVLDPASGNVSIAQGPVQNLLLCLGMLDMARFILLRKLLSDAPLAPPKIVPGNLGDLDGLIRRA